MKFLSFAAFKHLYDGGPSALKLLNTGGVSSPVPVTEPMFLEIISEAAADARRRVQIVERRTQARDHPVLAGVPETLYLKCVIARTVE